MLDIVLYAAANDFFKFAIDSPWDIQKAFITD